MRILIIKGKNLASLEQEFVIDFTQEPLSSSGIFAITGPTGGGKSTILDALCLALYDNAPRYAKAEQLKQDGDEGDKITLQDPRNILRKGSSEGFAIVEFMALDDQHYRAEWYVKRARGKSEGTIQPAQMKLFNVTQNTEVGGTKTRIKEKLVQLVGLTFEQFTRAVLLAQGDFASFLIANTSQKAELLEKLTGTEIYSRISSEIYQKTSGAKNELMQVEDQIKNLDILSDEALSSISQENKKLKENIESISVKILKVNSWIKWLKDRDLINKNIDYARAELKNLLLTEEKNQERKNYLILAENIKNEIKDKYFEYQDLVRRLNIFIESHNAKKIEEENLNRQLEVNKKELEALKSGLENLNKKYDEATPLIDKAKSFDVQLDMLSETVKEREKRNKKYKEDIEKIKINEVKKEIDKVDKNIKAAEDWLVKNKFFGDILGNVPLITKTIESYYADTNLLSEVKKHQSENKKISETLQNTLNLYLEELEKLEQQLPTEVQILRSKLEEGCPCLVCGSKTHPYTSQSTHISEKSDAELEKAKISLNEKIISTKDSIEKVKSLLTRYEIDIENLDKRIFGYYASLEKYLDTYSDWKKQLDETVLVKNLNCFTEKWNKCQNGITNFRQERIKLSSTLEGNINLKKEFETEMQTLVDSLNRDKSKYSELETERKNIFQGKSIKDVESYFKNAVTKQTADIENSENQIKKSSNIKAELSGSLKEMDKHIKELEIDKTVLMKVIEKWKAANPNINESLLQELTGKSDKWMKNEKQFFNDLDNKKIELDTTLKERMKNLENHQMLENRPLSDEDTIENLNDKINLLNNELEEIKPIQTACEFKIVSHENNKAKSKELKSELDKKRIIYENWARLNDMLGSADGSKFKKIAQGYTLDVLLEFANYHLLQINKRYQLEKIPSTLGLRVVDKDMFDEVRPVNCLSGGESFLVSLALALGLSSLSSNKLQIESLFIDEGFGSLDAETLSMAMDALENLQTLGRRIGVISHVEEMKDRIPVQVRVNKKQNGGSSIVSVVGW